MSYRIQFDIFCNTPREVFIILEDNLSNVPIGKIEYYLQFGESQYTTQNVCVCERERE